MQMCSSELFGANSVYLSSSQLFYFVVALFILVSILQFCRTFMFCDESNSYTLFVIRMCHNILNIYMTTQLAIVFFFKKGDVEIKNFISIYSMASEKYEPRYRCGCERGCNISLVYVKLNLKLEPNRHLGFIFYSSSLTTGFYSLLGVGLANFLPSITVLCQPHPLTTRDTYYIHGHQSVIIHFYYFIVHISFISKFV